MTTTDINFYYQVGPISTTFPWFRPTPERIKNLVKEAKQIKDYQKYTLFLVGGVVNGKLGKTWDVDIVINGDISDLDQYQNFLAQLYDLALNKHGLLIDVCWLDKKPVNTHQNIEYTAVMFGEARKRIGNDESVMSFKNSERLTEYLIRKKIQFPTRKALETNKINYIEL